MGIGSQSMRDATRAHEPEAGRTPRKAALASWIGSALEYYDFFIYGTAAALVFNRIFFPGSEPATGTLLALATFGVGYVARPVGAFFLGHVGDKFGRKKVLVLTLILMGASTFLVGCLPTYQTAGVWAPVLLVFLRLCQGFSASGEQAGANSMTLEHAPPDRRAFFTSFTLSGTQAGLILATAVFLPVSSLPEEQLLAWGWRVPFWLSVVVVGIGYWIRRTLEETPAFREEQAQQKVPRMPLAVLFRDYLPEIVRVVLCALVSAVSTIFGVYALSFGVNTMHLPRSTMLWVAILTNIVALAAIPLWAIVADRVGRKPIFVLGAIIPGILMFLYLGAIGRSDVPMMFVWGILMSGVFYSASNGVWPSFYAEMFDTRVRLSGMAIGTQIGFALAGFGPTIAAAIQRPGADGWLPVAWLTLGACIAASVAALTARETSRLSMHNLGKPVARAAT